MPFENFKHKGNSALTIIKGDVNVAAIDRVYKGGDIVWPTQAGNVQIVNKSTCNDVYGGSNSATIDTSSWNILPGDVLVALMSSYSGNAITASLDTGAALTSIHNSVNAIRTQVNVGYALGGEDLFTISVGSSCYFGASLYQVRGAFLPVVADLTRVSNVTVTATPSDFGTDDAVVVQHMAVNTTSKGSMNQSMTGTGNNVILTPAMTHGQTHVGASFARAAGSYLESGTYSGTTTLRSTTATGNEFNANVRLILRGVPAS